MTDQTGYKTSITNKFLVTGLYLLVFSMIAPFVAVAADTTPSTIECGMGGILLPGCQTTEFEKNPSSLGSKYIPVLAFGFIAITGVVAVLTLMIGGMMYLTSLGNDEKIKKATKMIYYSLLGLLFAIFSYAIVQIVVNLQFT